MQREGRGGEGEEEIYDRQEDRQPQETERETYCEGGRDRKDESEGWNNCLYSYVPDRTWGKKQKQTSPTIRREPIKTMDQRTSPSTNQTINRSINRSTDQFTDQPGSHQPTNQPTNQSKLLRWKPTNRNQPTNQPCFDLLTDRSYSSRIEIHTKHYYGGPW